MLQLRIITSIIGIPLLLGLLYFGGAAWWGVFIVIGAMALFEYYQMMTAKGHQPLYLSGYLLMALIFYSVYNNNILIPGLSIVLGLSLFHMVVKYPAVHIDDVSLSFFGAFLISYMLSYALQIYYLSNHFLIILLALLLTWGSDTGAYFIGKSLGKRRLAPALSPNKTIAGALGGIFFSSLVAVLFFQLIEWGQLSPAYALLLGILISILAQLGDLTVSGMKRYFGVKDSGKIIPGHGGVLDRLDSFLLVLPLMYYFMTRWIFWL